MGALSPSHLIIILVLVLLLFGAKKIPELAKGLGQGMKEFKKGVNDSDEIEKGKSDGESAKSENRTNSVGADSESIREEDRESVDQDTATR